jgi:DNA-binding MarR family transcriptional regulator
LPGVLYTLGFACKGGKHMQDQKLTHSQLVQNTIFNSWIKETTGNEFKLIVYFYRNSNNDMVVKNHSYATIKKATKINGTTISKLVKSLEKKGIIQVFKVTNLYNNIEHVYKFNIENI